MSVTVSEYVTAGSSTPTSMQDNPEHKEGLLATSRPKTSERMLHTARGLEAIGFNEHASMYKHGFRQHSIDSEPQHKKKGDNVERPGGPVERKRTMSFIRRLCGKEREREEGMGKGEKI